MKRLILGCCLLLAACGEQPKPEAVDGDTVRINGDRVRLWGIDAPELEQTCLDGGWRRYNCGQAARNALQHYINLSGITCNGIYRDKYDRRVAQCWRSYNGTDIASMMARSGWALSKVGNYDKDESYARDHKLGIHEGPFITPEEYRIKHQR